MGNVNLYGLDFVESSAKLINELGQHYGANMEGFVFDMKVPDLNYHIKENSCVFTACAIEQLNSNFKPFIDYVVEQKPKICFHLEPLIENYDENNDFDKLAIRFHLKRGYSVGLKSYLSKLQKEKKLKIIFDKRLKFGSLFHEGYQVIAWEPLRE